MANKADASIVFDTRLDPQGFSKGLDNIDKQFVGMKKTLVDVASASGSMFGNKNQAQIDKYSDKLAKQLNAMDRQRDVVENLQAQLDRLASGDAEVKSLVAMETQLRKNEEETAKLEAQYAALARRAEELEQYSQIKGPGIQPVSPEDLAEAARLDGELMAIGERVAELTASSSALSQNIQEIKLNPETSQEAIALSDKIGLAQSKLSEMAMSAGTAEKQVKKALDEKQPVKFSEALSRGKGALAALIAPLKDVGKHTKSTNSGFDKMIKKLLTMAKTAFVFRLIRNGLNEIRKYVGGLLSTNADFTASLNLIKVNLMTAFQPIYEAILPALNDLMSALSRATYYIASFISLLFGKTYEESRKAAQAMNQEKEALAGVGKAAKESTKFLAKFDDINQAAADNAGGAGSEFSDLFGQVEVPELDISWLKEFKEKLLDIFPDEDYFKGLGKKMADWIVNGLNIINWAKTQEWAYSLASKLAAFLNGALANPDLWIAMGATLAEMFNTAVIFLLTFAQKFDWTGFGKAIAAGINAFFETFNWSSAGLTLSMWALGLLTGLIAAIRDVDWKLIGESVKEFLSAIDWWGIITAVFELMGEALGAIHDFLVGLIGEPFADMLMGIATAIGAFMIAEQINKLFPDLTQGFGKLSNSLLGGGFLALGATIAYFIAFNDLAPELTIALGTLAGALTGIGLAITLGGGPLGILVGIISGLVTALGSIAIALSDTVIPSVQHFDDTISDTSKTLAGPILDSADKVRESLVNIFLEGKPIVESDSYEIIGYFTEMANQSIYELERLRDRSKMLLAEAFGDEAVEYERLSSVVNSTYQGMIDAENKRVDNLQTAYLQNVAALGAEDEATIESKRIFEEAYAAKGEAISSLEATRDAELLKLQENASTELQAYIDQTAAIDLEYDNRKQVITDAQTEQTELLKAHLEAGETLDREAFERLLTGAEGFASDMLDVVVKDKDDRLRIAEIREQDLTSIDVNGISNRLTAAAKERDEKIQAAYDTYTQIEKDLLAHVDTMTQEEYDFAIQQLNYARDVRDGAIEAAEEQYKEVGRVVTEGQDGINEVVNVKTGELKTQNQKAYQGIGTWIASWFKGGSDDNYLNAKNMGDQTNKGLEDGLSQNKNKVSAAWEKNINDMFAAGNEAADIHSPSGVAEEQGKYIIDGILLAFENGIVLIKQAAILIMTTIKDTVISSTPAVLQAFTDTYNGILSKTEMFANNYMSAIRHMCQQSANMLASMPDAQPIMVPMYTQLAIPRLASGGLVNASTVAMIGERGREAVIPLDRNTEWAEILSSILAEKLSDLGIGESDGGLTMSVSGTLAPLIRLLNIELKKENRRQGSRIQTR